MRRLTDIVADRDVEGLSALAELQRSAKNSGVAATYDRLIAAVGIPQR